MGIAQRQIRAARAPDSGITQHRKTFPTELKTLGDFLRKARIEHGLNQKQLAARLQVSRNRIQDWEGNQNIPSTEDWKALTAVLSILALPESLVQ